MKCINKNCHEYDESCRYNCNNIYDNPTQCDFSISIMKCSRCARPLTPQEEETAEYCTACMIATGSGSLECTQCIDLKRQNKEFRSAVYAFINAVELDAHIITLEYGSAKQKLYQVIEKAGHGYNKDQTNP